jgi:hypothetical protein
MLQTLKLTGPLVNYKKNEAVKSFICYKHSSLLGLWKITKKVKPLKVLYVTNTLAYWAFGILQRMKCSENNT